MGEISNINYIQYLLVTELVKRKTFPNDIMVFFFLNFSGFCLLLRQCSYFHADKMRKVNVWNI